MCGRLQEDICFCCSAPTLLSYWTERCSWKDNTHHLFDQSGADRAISRLDSANLTRVQKLRCGWLPVNRRLSREDPDRMAGCAACRPVDSVDKTVDHVLQCLSPVRRGLLTERLSSFTATLREWKTAPIICQILSAAAHHWILTPWDDFEFHVPDDTPSRQLVLSAIKAQAEIGWGLMFRGFLSSDWRRIQDAFFAQRTGISGKLDTGQHCARQLVSWYFETFHIAWFQRNLDEHGSNKFGQHVILKARIARTIRRLYAIGESFPDHERHPICKDSIETILDATLHLQELWIARSEAYILRARKRIQTSKGSNRRSLTEFFLQSNRQPAEAGDSSG
jgi:hypothetical protein